MPKSCKQYIEHFFRPTGSESQDQRQKLAITRRWQAARDKYTDT